MKQENKNLVNNNGKELLETLVCALFYILACVYLPLSFFLPMGELASAMLALGISIVSILVLAKAARSFHAILTYALILGIFVLFGGMLLPIGLFSAFAAGSCVYALLILKKRNPFVWGLPLIPIIISLLLFKNGAAILLSAATLPCSLLLAYSIKNKVARVGAVCRISLGICIFAVLMFMGAVYSVSGELSVSAAKSLIDTAREQLVTMLNSLTSEMGERIGYNLNSSDVKNIIELTVASMFNLLPAIVITIANIIAYIIHSLYLSVTCITDEDRKQALPMLSFEMSLHSAVIYVLALVLALVLVSDSVAIYGTAAENMLLILAPGLILTALAGIRVFNAKKGPSCLGTLIYFAVIFMLASLSPFAIIGVSLAGAILTIVAHIAKAKADKQNNAR